MGEIPSTVHTLNEEAVRELATFRCEAGGLSFYLDLDPRLRPSWDDVEAAAVQLASRARKPIAQPPGENGEGSDADVVLARLGQGIDRSGARGLAVFSCRQQGFFRQYALLRPTRDFAAFSRRFRIAPLEEAVAADGPLLAALVDRQRCRLFRSTLAQLEEVTGPLDPAERGVDVDRELGGFERHDEEALRRHVRRSADALAREAKRHPAAPILLGGTEPAVSALARLLPAGLRQRLAGSLPVIVNASAAEVSAALEESRSALERQAEADAVERIRRLAGERHGAVAGLGPALGALRQHRVETLVVSRTLAAPAASCPACGWLGESAAACPDCGTATDNVDDGVELSIEEAAAQRARVVFADDPHLDAIGGIAVLERF